MLTKLIISICTISILPKISLSQYYSNQYYQNIPQQFYPRQQPEPAEIDYEEPMEHEYRRHGRPNMYARPPSVSRIERDDDEYETDADYDDCKCSCTRCSTHPHKPCCREVCQTCEEMRQSQQDQPGNPQLQQGQGNVLFVPYPYPLMVPNNNVRNDAKTTTTSTTTTTTTTTEDPDKAPHELKKIDKELFQKKSSVESNLYKNQMMKNERRYMLTTVRKTKPAWEPKYGIVPIPDTLAEKLMNQLRQDHSRKM